MQNTSIYDYFCITNRDTNEKNISHRCERIRWQPFRPSDTTQIRAVDSIAQHTGYNIGKSR